MQFQIERERIRNSKTLSSCNWPRPVFGILHILSHVSCKITNILMSSCKKCVFVQGLINRWFILRCHPKEHMWPVRHMTQSRKEGQSQLVLWSWSLFAAGAWCSWVLRDCGESASDLSAQGPKDGNVCPSVSISSLIVHSLALQSLCMPEWLSWFP